MATTQEEKDKEMERKTAIVGNMPDRDTYAKENAKWDNQGNLIDEDEIAKEQRERDIILGKIKPTIEDYHDKEFGERVIGTVETNQSISDEAVANAEKMASDPDAVIVPPPATLPEGEPVSLAGMVNEPVAIPKPEPETEANIGTETDDGKKKR